jgi:tetratricopeptide (TPR) repeat protein
MSSCPRVFHRSIVALIVIAVLAMIAPERARAGSFEDALALVRSSDVHEIEGIFESRYQDFVAGKITVAEFNTPYNAFHTLEPVVGEMIAAWREAYPGSAHARVAEAGPVMNLATILRGEAVIRLVPRTSFTKARVLWAEASRLYSEALDIAPRHVMAAGGLQDAAQLLGDDQAALRAKRILAVHGSQVALLLNELHESTPQWGGSVAKMRRLCDTIAPKVEGITVAECHARATLMLWDQPQEVREEAIAVLRREDEAGNRFTIARQLLYLGRAQEALDMYDAWDAWISGSLAPVFARALNNYAVQERIVDRWLAVNPLHPRHLAMKSEAQGFRGDFTGAAESIEKAMVYGETIPEVRRWRFAAMMQDESRHEQVLGEIEDALVDTDFHPLIMEFAVSALIWDKRPIRYWSDGTEHSNYECRRLRILSNAFGSCAQDSERNSTLGCSDSSLKRIQQIISEADFAACKGLAPLQ